MVSPCTKIEKATTAKAELIMSSRSGMLSGIGQRQGKAEGTAQTSPDQDVLIALVHRQAAAVEQRAQCIYRNGAAQQDEHNRTPGARLTRSRARLPSCNPIRMKTTEFTRNAAYSQNDMICERPTCEM